MCQKGPSFALISREEVKRMLWSLPLYYLVRPEKLTGGLSQTVLTSLPPLLVAGIMSFILVMFLTPWMIRLALKARIVDMPAARKIHKQPMPLLGGFGIFIAFFVTTVLFTDMSEQIRCILIGSGTMFLMGTLDDMYSLSSKVRLFGQLVASLIVISSGLMINFAQQGGWLFFDIGLTLFWIIGIINAFNFMDGMDGLATGIAMIVSGEFLMALLTGGQQNVLMLAAILMGGTMAFLFYNFKPAKIYLGDGGSTFLGFLLACLALLGEWSDKGPLIAFGVPALIFGVLIFDMIYITISRVRNGLVHNLQEWLDYTGKDHFHHRLVHMGFSERQAVIFIYLKFIILGLSAAVLRSTRNVNHVMVLLAQAVFIFSGVSALMLAGRNLTPPRQEPEPAALGNNVMPLNELPVSENVCRSPEEIVEASQRTSS